MSVQKLSAIVAIAATLASGIYWISQNVVWAGDYREHVRASEERWIMYQQDKLWREYRELKSQDLLSPFEKERMAAIERAMRDNDIRLKSLMGGSDD